MKMNPFLFAALLTPVVTVAWADINLGRPAPARGNIPHQHGIYHSDLMASNTVHAIFKGLRTIPVVDLAMPSPGTQEVAVFEVKQNLAHLRYDRMGDEAMNPGKLFPVSLAADVPGQAADLGNKIRELKPGDEALLCVDHIYLYRDSGNESVRAVTRFAKVRPNPSDAAPPANGQQSAPPAQESTEPQGVPAAPAAPDAVTAPAAPAPIAPVVQPPAPLTPRSGNYARSVESRFSIEPDGKGGYRRTQVEVIREWDQDTGKESVRKYINGTEVDPNTDKPLTPAAPAAPAAPADPAASPAPAAPTTPAAS